MKTTFNNIHFTGKLRDYQQRVVDNFDHYIKDRKIHIVASPGSGKTVLGLELIRRLGHPALILSPSITIREQWGERFDELFNCDSKPNSECFSHDIRYPKLLTSITYQALHSAVSRNIGIEKVEDGDSEEEVEIINFEEFNVISAIKQAGIKTICLDEAHHLKSEWHKAISKIIDEIGNSCFIVSLTATPPYDSKEAEWSRYEQLCGVIDDEIFVPELVVQKALCPHQDYIYFSYPSLTEVDKWIEYREIVNRTVYEILSDLKFQSLISLPFFTSYKDNEELLFDYLKQFISLLVCINNRGDVVPQKLISNLLPSKQLPAFTLEFAETAFQFIIDREDLFDEDLRSFVRKKLTENELCIRKKVSLISNEKLRRMTSSSLGKLESIITIVKAEYRKLGQSLQMLVLTDFIKSDLKSIIGTDKEIGVLGTVTIFEAIRRNVTQDLRLALLSGGLVIVHKSTLEYIYGFEVTNNITISKTDIDNTDYCELSFNGANKHKVALITFLFNRGDIDVIIGTKSLLGEGWDAPCINALILASFVGSFVSSNQMRGRAIRTERLNPAKSANIWHLVTVNPDNQTLRDDNFEMNENVIHSEDYELCCRKFEHFMAPAYTAPVIENGIQRCDIIKPPYHHSDFDRINREMLQLSEDRELMVKKWDILTTIVHPRIMQVDYVPCKDISNKKFVYYNAFAVSVVFCVLEFLYEIIKFGRNTNGESLFMFYIILAALILFVVGFINVNNIIRLLSPKHQLNKLLASVLSVLRDMGEISSSNVSVVITQSVDGVSLKCGLINATRKEQVVFSTAVKEMLSSIDAPRYLLIKRSKYINKLLYLNSYACPSIIGAKKENVDRLIAVLKSQGLLIDAIFTRNLKGREHLLQCRKKSIRNRNETVITGKKIVKDEYE